jgi:hypothetical protein
MVAVKRKTILPYLTRRQAKWATVVGPKCYFPTYPRAPARQGTTAGRTAEPNGYVDGFVVVSVEPENFAFFYYNSLNNLE